MEAGGIFILAIFGSMFVAAIYTNIKDKRAKKEQEQKQDKDAE